MSPAPPLPPEFLTRLERIIPPTAWPGVAASFAVAKPTSFRVNTLKATPAQVLEELAAQSISPVPVDWSELVFQVPPEARSSLTHSRAAMEGDLYVQGLSSILAAFILAPQPGETVLDLAAAPGGKATHLAAMMDNQGRLNVVEPIRKRMFRLADNLRRMGVTISHTYLMDGRAAGRKVPERFDRVLLDAPCSGEARIHVSRPDSHSIWSPRKIREQARKQKGLIESAFKTLKPGGNLLYATCSFAPEENEAIVHHLLSTVGDSAEVLPIELPIENWQAGLVGFDNQRFDDMIQLTRRILPSETADGFYYASIRKRG